MVSIEIQRSILTNSNKLQLSILLPIFIIGHVSQNMIETNYDENERSHNLDRSFCTLM